MPDTPEPDSVSTIGVKLTPFWEDEPRVWFAQAEQVFSLKKITTDATKFAHIIGALSQEVAKSVKDILIMPPDSDKYCFLKERLCSSYSPSDYESAFKLFNLPSSYNEKPIKIMERMLGLLPHDTKPCWLFQFMFLQKLPEVLRCELARLDLKDFVNDPRGLALEATKHWEKLSASTSSVLSEDTELFAVGPGRNKPHPPTQPLCYFHHRFGSKAQKCRDPCSWFPKGNGRGRSGSRN